MRRTFLTGMLAVLLTTPPMAFAQEPGDTIPLERLIVTATRVPLPADAVPASVTVIDGSELRARGVRFLADALRTTAGTAIAQTGSHGGITSLYMRGGESDYVQVLIDGVPANQPGGAFDFAHLRIEDVERVEIVRGPVSVLYGSAAVTGVIHVITRRGATGTRVSGSLSGGGSGRVGSEAEGMSRTLAFDAGVSGRASGVQYAASVGHFDTGGIYAFNNDYDNTNASAHVGFGSERSSVQLNGRLTDNEYHFPTDGAGRLVDRNQFSSGRTFTGGATATHAFRPSVRGTLEAALLDGESRSIDDPDSPGDTTGFYAANSFGTVQRRSLDARLDVRALADAVISLGAAVERQDGSTAMLTLSDFGPFADTADYTRSTRSAYAQVVATPSRMLTITGGTRLDDGSRFGSFVTWRAGASLRPGMWVLRAAAGTGFKEPTFYENFAQGFVIGNPTLDPERSLSAELGVERAIGTHLRVGATAYTQEFRDLIQYTFAPTRPGESNYFNLGRARARGIETTAALSIGTAWQLDAAWDWLDTEVLESGDEGDLTFVEGSRLLRRPAHRLSAALTWQSDVADAAVTITHVGERDDLDFSDPAAFSGKRVVLDGYTLLNASVEVPIARTISGLVRIENALGAEYAEVVGFPARGRAVLLGLRAALSGS